MYDEPQKRLVAGVFSLEEELRFGLHQFYSVSLLWLKRKTRQQRHDRLHTGLVQVPVHHTDRRSDSSKEFSRSDTALDEMEQSRTSSDTWCRHQQLGWMFPSPSPSDTPPSCSCRQQTTASVNLPSWRWGTKKGVCSSNLTDEYEATWSLTKCQS